MYSQQSIQDSLFLMLYGGVAMLAVMAGLYLWLRRSNGILPDITPPRALRRWTAAFFLMSALSHVLHCLPAAHGHQRNGVGEKRREQEMMDIMQG